MSIGMILLVVVAVLALFGVLRRMLERMRLTDRQALVAVAAIFIGGWIPDIRITQNFYLNIGGALLPIALCVYLFARAGSARERARAAVAAVVSACAVYALLRFLPGEPVRLFVDPVYLCGIAAGVVACALGRSRRAAFIAGAMSILLADAARAAAHGLAGQPFTLRLGGGGMFDAVVLAAILAVAFAELFGELRERMRSSSAGDVS